MKRFAFCLVRYQWMTRNRANARDKLTAGESDDRYLLAGRPFNVFTANFCPKFFNQFTCTLNVHSYSADTAQLNVSLLLMRPCVFLADSHSQLHMYVYAFSMKPNDERVKNSTLSQDILSIVADFFWLVCAASHSRICFSNWLLCRRRHQRRPGWCCCCCSCMMHRCTYGFSVVIVSICACRGRADSRAA